MSQAATKFEQVYVDYHHGGYWVAGTRVSLDSLVYRWREGLSAEKIQKDCFPVLTLAHVYGALAYYLDHKDAIDEYLVQQEAEEEVFRQQLREAYPEAARRMDELAKRFPFARHEDQVSG